MIFIIEKNNNTLYNSYRIIITTVSGKIKLESENERNFFLTQPIPVGFEYVPGQGCPML